MQRIISALVLFLLSVFNLIADPSDYGKDYSFREGHSNTPIWFVILVVVGIVMIYQLIYMLISKLDNHKNVKDITSRTQIYPSIKVQNHRCPNCNGVGFIKAGPVYSDYEMCEYCHGYGKELNDNALKYHENIKTEQRRRREECQEITDKRNRAIFAFIYNQLPCESSHLFEEELKKCNTCTHCNGKGEIELSTFYEMDEHLNMIKYKRLICPQCNGTGTIVIKQ